MKIQFLSRRNHFQLLCRELEPYNIEYEIIDNRKARNFFALPSRYYINRLNSDLLVSHNPYYGLYGAKQAKISGKIDELAFRLKADHWTELDESELSYKHKIGNLIKRYQYNSSINYVDFIISISEYMKNVANSHNIDKKIYIMYNGVDIERFHERNVDPKYSSELLCIMNFNIPKKILLLENFFKLYKEMDLKYKVNVLGDGEFLDRIKLLVKHLGLTEKITFKGYVTDIEYYYNNCDIVIHPSNLESFGMIFLEAGASAKPCVTTSEIIVNNKTGFITASMYEFINKIDSLMGNPEKRIKIGKNAKKRIYESFTWNKIAEMFVKILEKENILT